MWGNLAFLLATINRLFSESVGTFLLHFCLFVFYLLTPFGLTRSAFQSFSYVTNQGKVLRVCSFRRIQKRFFLSEICRISRPKGTRNPVLDL